MSDLTRDLLKAKFENGDRPSQDDFSNLIDSFINKASDGVKVDTDQNLVLTRGLQLGDSAGTVAGGLRFNSNQLQVFTGGAWVNVASGGGGGGFQKTFPTPPPSGGVACDGNVGIGSFASAPTFRLDVPFDDNTGPATQVRFGNVVCANGSGPNNKDFAVFAHRQQAATTSINDSFALRQHKDGPVTLNAPLNQVVSICQGGGGVRLGISTAGHVIVGGTSELPGAPASAVFQVAGDVFKTPSNVWGTSDARVKEDVRDLELGLSELRQVRPVRFRYNGRAGTPAGRVSMGVLGQEIETIVPETIQRVSVADDPELDDLRVFDPSALTYVLINAVKELAARVEHLEQALAAATAPTAGPQPIVA